MSTTKLDDRHAIRGDILDLHTIDGRPIRVVYPTWNSLYPSSFKTISDEYMNGKNNSGKNCYNQVRNMLNVLMTPLESNPSRTEEENILLKKYKTVLHGLLPISTFTTSKYPRELYAYGIYGALSSGMQLDFTRIVNDIKLITKDIYSNDFATRKNAERTLNRLTLHVRRMNYIGCMLTAPANTSATCTNIIRALTMDSKEIAQLPNHVKEFIKTFNDELHSKVDNPYLFQTLQSLTPSQYKELLGHVNKLTTNATNRISDHVNNATRLIERNDIFKPMNDSSIKDATLEGVVDNMIEVLGRLPQQRLSPQAVMDAIKSSTLTSFNELEATIDRDVYHNNEAAEITERNQMANYGSLSPEVSREVADEYSFNLSSASLKSDTPCFGYIGSFSEKKPSDLKV